MRQVRKQALTLLTPLNSAGGFGNKLEYLDRQDVTCGASDVMQAWTTLLLAS
jgi:hypothetical protein